MARNGRASAEGESGRALTRVRPGFAGFGWHGGGRRGGGWQGDGWGPPVVGGLAAGALLAAPYAYGYGYGGCYACQPMYDVHGNTIGQQAVRTC